MPRSLPRGDRCQFGNGRQIRAQLSGLFRCQSGARELWRWHCQPAQHRELQALALLQGAMTKHTAGRRSNRRTATLSTYAVDARNTAYNNR
jgi:hypothetical protein